MHVRSYHYCTENGARWCLCVRVCKQGFASVGPAAGSAASALAPAVLRTKPLLFSGKGEAPALFINAIAAGNISIAVLDASTGVALGGLDHGSYIGATDGTADSERLRVEWQGSSDDATAAGAAPLSKAQGKAIVLEVKFSAAAARLYSFWFASDGCGASMGWVAAGGIGFNSSRDTVGLRHADPTCSSS